MTGDEADRRSAGRALHNRQTINLLALFAFLAVLILAGLLQYQAHSQAVYVHKMCLQRQVNTAHTNATWTELERIEQHNKFIDAQIRSERLAAFESAKLVVPTCT